MKICIIGNSVPLRIRPPRRDGGELTYAEYLEKDGHRVEVFARAGTTIREGYALLEDDVVSRFPDFVIINYGVVEVCCRQTIRAINNKTIRNSYLNVLMGRPFICAGVFNSLTHFSWRLLNGLVRRFAALVGVRWCWLRPSVFVETMAATVELVLKETRATVVIIGVNNCADRVERILSGSGEAIAETNKRLCQWAQTQGGRVIFLDPNLFLAGDEGGELVPDGVHYSAKGHQLLYGALCGVCTNRPQRGI